MAEIKYTKSGEVTLSPPTGGEITLENPTGRVIGFEYDPVNEVVNLTIEASDHLNTVQRRYSIPMDEQAIATFTGAFFTEVARLAAGTHVEFQNLTLL